jgi:hypothetical protein
MVMQQQKVNTHKGRKNNGHDTSQREKYERGKVLHRQPQQTNLTFNTITKNLIFDTILIQFENKA